MKHECFNALLSLNEEDLKNCNGGIALEQKKLLPPIVYPLPVPDPDGVGGRL